MFPRGGGNVVLWYAHRDATFLLLYDPTIPEHPVEYGQHVTLDAVPVKFKKFQTDAILPGALLQAPLLTAAFRSSDPLQ